MRPHRGQRTADAMRPCRTASSKTCAACPSRGGAINGPAAVPAWAWRWRPMSCWWRAPRTSTCPSCRAWASCPTWPTWFLDGSWRARAVAFAARRAPAGEQAAQLGLVWACVDDAELRAQAVPREAARAPARARGARDPRRVRSARPVARRQMRHEPSASASDRPARLRRRREAFMENREPVSVATERGCDSTPRRPRVRRRPPAAPPAAGAARLERPVLLARIGGGQSNPTFFVDFDNRRAGAAQAAARRTAALGPRRRREYRVLRALAAPTCPCRAPCCTATTAPWWARLLCHGKARRPVLSN